MFELSMIPWESHDFPIPVYNYGGQRARSHASHDASLQGPSILFSYNITAIDRHITTIWTWLKNIGAPPNKSLKSIDHDFALKPMVTWGSPIEPTQNNPIPSSFSPQRHLRHVWGWTRVTWWLSQACVMKPVMAEAKEVKATTTWGSELGVHYKNQQTPTTTRKQWCYHNMR